jgi:hypothetical protein
MQNLNLGVYTKYSKDSIIDLMLMLHHSFTTLINKKHIT